MEGGAGDRPFFHYKGSPKVKVTPDSPRKIYSYCSLFKITVTVGGEISRVIFQFSLT